MSWTTPASWSVGESPTAAKLNTHIRDNLAWLHDSIPTVSLYADAPQTITNATWTTLLFPTETYDNDTMHSTSSNTGRITVATAGIYLVVGQVTFEAITDPHELGLRVRVDGSGILAAQRAQSVNRDGTGVSISFISGQISAASYFELQAIQETGGSIDTYVTDLGVHFGATRLAT